MILLDSDGHTRFLQWVLAGDRRLFTHINQEWTNSFFDSLFPFLRQAEIWVPLYLFLLVFITLNFGRKGWLWALSFIMTVVCSDLVSSHLMKSVVMRLRPCQDPDLASSINILVTYCPMSSSFTSSHACNHFAMATFIYYTLRQTSRWWAAAFVWAFLISYAQVYVGVHYPVDVASGALLGCLIGYGASRIFLNRFGMLTNSSFNYSHG